MIKSQKGQVVVLLLLVMVVALAVGLSTISRSTLEVSTSRKSEDSSRAFSAAEAGMERIIQANKDNLGGVVQATIAPFSLGNESSAVITTAGLPSAGLGLAYPPFGKESFAQFWLVYPNFTGSPASSYVADSFDIYFGDPDATKYVNPNEQEKPAVEVSTIYWDGNKYQSQSNYYDSFDGTADNTRSQGFQGCSLNQQPIQVNDDDIAKTNFYCKATVDINSITSGNSFPVMVRVRILYSSISHPVAIIGKNTSGVRVSIPKQANIYTSKGTSGSVQRKLQVFSQKSVMPQFFNYALFSAAELSKGQP